MMSHSQSSGADYKGRAIVLLSGLSDESPTQAIEAVLRSYSLRIDGQQEITMAGRYIGAFELSLDQLLGMNCTLDSLHMDLISR
jgi:hypothetical protein